MDASTLAGIYCLFAVGLSLTWGALNVLNLAHGAVFISAAFACYLLTNDAHVNIPVWQLVLLGMAVGAVLELMLAVLIFSPIRKRNATERAAELSMVIATVGAAGIITSVVQGIYPLPFPVTAEVVQQRVWRVLGAAISELDVVIFTAAVICTVALAVWLSRSRLGRATRAIAADRETAKLMGISDRGVSCLTLVLSGVSAGLAGVFMALYLNDLDTDSAQSLLLKGFAVVVLGGVGSMWGTLIGACVLATSETLVTATTSGTWTQGISFGVIVVVLLLRPRGLLGRQAVDRA